jgi:hypothetical protein
MGFPFYMGLYRGQQMIKVSRDGTAIAGERSGAGTPLL